MVKIRIGTRGSKLALWQAEWVAGALQGAGHEVELVKIATQGDVSTASLSQVGGQGLFTKEIQKQLLAGHVDLAVHSLKDLPTLHIPGLRLAAVPPRETTADCLLSRQGLKFAELPSGATIGTGSARRAAQLLAWRDDVVIQDIRGNVDSRIRKMDEGEYEAIVLAAAGLTRLGLVERVSEYLPQDKVLPAIGQGALGLECRDDDEETAAALAPLNDLASMAAVTAERTLLAGLLAGCLAPVAGLGQVTAEGRLRLTAGVFSRDGKQALRASLEGELQQPGELGNRLAEELKSQGAADLIAAIRA